MYTENVRKPTDFPTFSGGRLGVCLKLKIGVCGTFRNSKLSFKLLLMHEYVKTIPHWRRSSVFIVKFENISHLVLVGHRKLVISRY